MGWRAHGKHYGGDSPAVRRRFAALRDPVTGEKLCRYFEKEVYELEGLVDRRPSVDITHTTYRPFSTHDCYIKTFVEEAVEKFEPEWKKTVLRAAFRVLELNHALYFADRQDEVGGTSSDDVANEAVKAKQREARAEHCMTVLRREATLSTNANSGKHCLPVARLCRLSSCWCQLSPVLAGPLLPLSAVASVLPL